MGLKPRLQGTVSDRRLTARTRSTADAAYSGCGELVTSFDYPPLTTLHRVWSWEKFTVANPSLERMAHHEAGHVVLLEWMGLESPRAVAAAEAGLTYLPENSTPPAAPSDPTGELTAMAAAMFHAGLMAELLHAGAPWHGPIHRLQDDHLRAEALLSEVFGAHSTGAHAFAQRVALHVLASRWVRVQEVAAQLVASGVWVPAS